MTGIREGGRGRGRLILTGRANLQSFLEKFYVVKHSVYESFQARY